MRLPAARLGCLAVAAEERLQVAVASSVVRVAETVLAARGVRLPKAELPSTRHFAGGKTNRGDAYVSTSWAEPAKASCRLEDWRAKHSLDRQIPSAFADDRLSALWE